MAENKKHVINDENKYESVSILLSKEKYPIAFEKYVTDMMQGGMTREEAEKYASEVLSIPMYNGITEEEQIRVIEALNKFKV